MPSPTAVDDNDPNERLSRIEARLEALETGTPLDNATLKGLLRILGSILVEGGGGVDIADGGDVRVTDGGSVDIQDGGRFRVRHPDELGGDDAVFAGDIYDQDTGAYLGTGLMVEQPDGTDILMARTDAATGGTTVYLKDRNGFTVIRTDPTAGGLSAPWLAFQMTPYRGASWESTNSATFVSLLHGYPRTWSPRAGLKVTLSCNGGTDGEARVLMNGAQVGAVAAVSGSAVTSIDYDFALPAPLTGGTAYIEVQGRVSSGTGSVFVNVGLAELRG